MAAIEQDLGSATVATITQQTALSVGASNYATVYSIVLTNNTGNIITVTVHVNDLLFCTRKIPASKATDIPLAVGLTLSGSDTIKLTAGSTDSWNYKINGVLR